MTAEAGNAPPLAEFTDMPAEDIDGGVLNFNDYLSESLMTGTIEECEDDDPDPTSDEGCRDC